MRSIADTTSVLESTVTEERMKAQSAIRYEADGSNLSPSPIYPGWVLEGNPVARNKLVSESADGLQAASYGTAPRGASIGSTRRTRRFT
jgi:hypothetical protein